MKLYVVAILALAALASSTDVGCKDSLAFGNYGKCIELGCCYANGQDSSTSLCSGGGSTETCCYRDYTCGSPQCINVYGTWISRYAYHSNYDDILQGMTALKNKGITRVYFNVWANGEIYALSNTADAENVVFGGDRLGMAVEIGASLGLEVFAWFEYGTQAAYQSLNQFAINAAAKGWLLCADSSCNNYFPSNYAYLDLTNGEVISFLGGMVADLMRNYPGLMGFQFDDHFAFPNEFPSVSNRPLSERYAITESAMVAMRDAALGARPNAHVSYSPSPLDFSRQEHNVDWASYLDQGVVMEIVPQYYRNAFANFQDQLDADLPRVPRHENGLVAGIRLSGSGGPTPTGDVDRMVDYSYDRNLRGVSFWFGDDIISDSSYNPPAPTLC